jgi:hypothetical protein
LLTLVCALVLAAAAAVFFGAPSPAEAKPQADLASQLHRQQATAQQSRQVLRFFDSHRWLLSDPRFAAEAQRQLERHQRTLAVATSKAAATKAEIARRTRVLAVRKAQKLRAVARKQEAAAAARARASSPRAVICKVFGDYCDEALSVAHCESRLDTGAHNGQYLGLFQMGSNERQLFGHGVTALQQAQAAHRYFVASGRDWSPWSCRP